MDAKEALEEFIRRESKPDLPETELQIESANQSAEIPELGQTEIEQDCKRTITTTEFDAIHPRFRAPQKPEVIEEFQRQNDYYCFQCKLYFAPTVEGLKVHFKGDMVKHRPIDECFYCKGAVYGYSFNSEKQIYHNCKNGN